LYPIDSLGQGASPKRFWHHKNPLPVAASQRMEAKNLKKKNIIYVATIPVPPSILCQNIKSKLGIALVVWHQQNKM